MPEVLATPNELEDYTTEILFSFKDNLRLEAEQIEPIVATPGQPLTMNWLKQSAPEIAQRIAAEQLDIEWIDEGSAVTLSEDSPIWKLTGNGADYRFAMGMYTSSGGYNNLYSKLWANPEDTFEDRFSFAAIEAGKPYLLRAHLVAPRLMAMLQHVTASMDGMDDYYDNLANGSDPDMCIDGQAEFLAATRVAYVMMANLMRKDDILTQAKQLGLSSSQLITDSAVELRM